MVLISNLIKTIISSLRSSRKWAICCLVLALFPFITAIGQNTYVDNFNTVSYTNNDGTANFSAGWTEVGENTSPTNGRIRISSNQLLFYNELSSSRSISRTLNLSGATGVKFGFSYDATNRGGEILLAQFWNNITFAWETVATIDSSITGSFGYQLTTDQISAVSEIRFISGSGSWDEDYSISIDNVEFSAAFGPIISIDDVSVDESAGNAIFTVTLFGGTVPGGFTVDYMTMGGTAIAGADYVASSGTLSFAGTDGETQIITIPILEDGIEESSETFIVDISNISSGAAGISRAQGIGTITDNDTFIITDGLSESSCSGFFYDSGGSGGNYNNYEDRTYTLCSSTPGLAIRVDFTSFDVEDNYDFLYIYEGSTTAGTLIGRYDNGNPPTVITSTDPSGCLTFRFTSDNIINGAGWRAAISCVPNITIDDVTVNEDAGSAIFTVTYYGGTIPGGFTAEYVTVNGSAIAGTDYVAASGAISFNGINGDTEQIEVFILDDTNFEPEETFTIQFTRISDVSVDFSDTGTGTIVSDEAIFSNTPLTLFQEFDGYMDYTSTGGTLRTSPNTANPCAITTSSSNTLSSPIPASGTIDKAILYWAHSGAAMDTQVTFEGTTVNAEIAYQTTLTTRTFHGYYADVTSLITSIPNPSTNVYDFSGLTIDTSSAYCNSATVLGGWALMIFYTDPSLPASTINLYQGFDGNSYSSSTFTLSGFYAIGSTGSKTTALSWEGDQTLANNESLLFTTPSSGTNRLAGDGDNNGTTVNNPFNSTNYDNTILPIVNNTTTYGLDLDTFDVSSFILPGESSATTQVNVGQDFVIMNAVVLKVPSNLITGSVFEDVNYGGGPGRNLLNASGVPLSDATVELYDSGGTLIQSTTTAIDGKYVFAGMANGSYSLRVVNESVRSSRTGGSGCTSCIPIQTFRKDYLLSTLTETTNEVGGANPSGVDSAAGILIGAQTVSSVFIADEGVAGLDFGFNFNTIVNTNEDGQGSLEQFIINTNELDETGLDIEANGIFDPGAGQDTSVFMIPSSTDPLGRTADTNFSSGYFDIFISDGNPLTDIAGSNTNIDGRTQTAYSGNTNAGTVGAGGSAVGTSGNPLPNFDLPEIQIHRDAGDVLVTQGTNTIISNVSIFADNNAGIKVDNGLAIIINNLIGVNATGINNGNITHGVEMNGGMVAIAYNYIATNVDAGVWINGGTYTLIYANHLVSNGDGPCDENILVQSGTGIVIQQNLIDSASGLGIEGISIPGNLIIHENTITNSGQDGGLCGAAIENAGMRLDGSNSAITNNIIASNGGAGLVLTGGTTSGNRISQNSIYANGTTSAALGIDLDNTGTVGDGITLNDNGDSDVGPNGLSNFPIISAAYKSGANLIVNGWSRPGATIEFFLTDINEGTAATGDNQLGLSTDYGEGQTYLGTAVEGSGADTDSSTGVYTDADGNTDNTNKFQFTIAVAPTVIIGNKITGTATIANTTSEFSPFSLIKVRTIITNRRITLRVNKN